VSSIAAAAPLAFVLTADRTRAKPFYAGALGLPIVAEDPYAVTFALAGGALVRLTDLPDHVPGAHTVLGWAVDDIRATVAELVGKGVTFRVYDGMGQDEQGIWQVPGGPTKVAWFTDPDGNVLSLTQF